MSPGLRLKLSFYVGLPVLLAAAVAGWVWLELSTPHTGWEGPGVLVELPRGLDAGSMLDRLADAGVLRSPRLARAWLVLRGAADRLHAGEYRFDRPASALEVLRRLELGDVVLHPVTVPEGLALEEVARRIEEAGLAEYEPLLEALKNPEPVLDLDSEATDLEGYLFPETYRFPRGETPHEIARTMVERFKQDVGAHYRAAAAEVGLTLRQAVTLASMIEKETSVPDERWRISRVFHNRLERGMRLQCDPTVLYALHRAGKPVDRLLLQHLEFDSPWNTYRIQGLPPGPICSPGRDSLDAAVHPAPGEELYFVATPGGGHRFSKDLASHRKAVREWRRYLRSSK